MHTKPTYEALEKELHLLKRKYNFQSLMNFSGIMVIEIDLNGVVVKVNKKGCDLLGYTENEILGKSWFDHFIPEHKKKEIIQISKKLLSDKAESVKHNENPVLTKKGEIRIMSWHNKPIINENGKITGHLSIGEDITERKKTEADLEMAIIKIKENKKILKEAQKIAQLGTFKLDFKTNLFESNNIFNAIVGISKSDIKSHEYYRNIIHPEDLAQNDYVFSNCLKNRKPYNRNYRIITENKKELKWINEIGRVVYENDEPSQFIGTIRDITKDKLIEQKLKASEDRFQFFSNATFEAIGMSIDGIIVDTNRRFCELTGYSKDELNGKPANILVHPDDKIKVATNIKTQNEGKIEFRVLRKDDTIIYVEARGRNIIINGKNARMVNMYDISERMEIKEQLIKSEEKFSKAYLNNPTPIFISSIPDGEFIDVNPTFEKISGRNRKDLIGNKVTDLDIYYNEQDRFKLFEELEKKGKLQAYEIEFKLKNGEPRNCLMFSEIIDIDNKPCLISIVNDITEQKKADIELKKQNEELTILGKKISENNRLLKESETKFKNLFDKNPVSLWDEDFSEVKRLLIKKKAKTNDLKKYLDENPDFVIECISKLEILNVNYVSLKLLGFSSKKELFTNFDKIFSVNSIEVFKEQLIAISQNKKEFSAETELIGRNGKIMDVLIKVVNITDDERAIVSIVDITELNKAKEKIVESEKQFRELYEKSGDAILIIKNGIFVDCNQATVDLLGYQSRKEFLNSHPSKLSPILQQNGQKSFDKAVDMMNMALRQGTHRFEWIHKKKNGENFPVEVLLTAISNEPNNQILHTVWRDITERKKGELKVNKISRLYATLSEINKAIITEEDQHSLFQKICQISINSGNFKLAWIGLVDKKNGSIEPAVFSGSRTDYLKDFKISLNNKFHAKGPTARAISEGRSIVFNDLVNNPDFEPWRKKAIEIGYNSSGAFPIKLNKSIIGVFNVYAYESLFFDQDEIDLLEEAALNISFALEKFELKKKQEKAETTLKNSEHELRNSQEIAQLGTYRFDLTDNTYNGSDIFKIIHGIKPGGKNSLDRIRPLIHPDDDKIFMNAFNNSVKNKMKMDIEYRIITENKKEVKWIHGIGEVEFIKEEASFLTGTCQDITERKLAELVVKESEKKLQEAQTIAKLGSYELDLNTKLFKSSSIFDTIVGLKSSNTKSFATWRTITHPEDSIGNQKMLEDCIESGKLFDREYRILTKNTGELKWLHGLGEIIYKEGRPILFRGTIQDITERKLNELKLIEVQKIANLGTYELDLITNEINSSVIYNSILGIKKKPINNKGWWKSITHSDDFEPSELLWQECLKNRKIYNDEYRIINSNNEIKWIHDIAEFKYEKNIATKAIGTIQDITERKIAELKLKENELKLNEAQKISKLGSFIFDDSTKLFESTEIFDEIVGIDPSYTKDLQGWINLIYPEDILIVQELLDNNSLHSISKEFRIVKYDNKKIGWVKGMAKIRYNENGVRQQVIGTLQDITERKLSEEKIKRSDDILKQVNSLVVVTNAKGDIIFISPSVKKILGFEPSAMLGRGWWRFTFPDEKSSRKGLNEMFNKFSKEEYLTNEVSVRKIRTNEGNYKLIEWHISKGTNDTFISIGIDITEKKEQEEQFKTLTETAHDSIILVDHNGKIFEWNKSSQNTFGYTKEEIEGKSITTLMPAKYRAQYQKGFNDVMQKGLKKSYRNNIVEGLTKEGKIFPMELSLNFWESNNNYVYCYFIRDITQRERNEKIKEVIYNITNKSNEAINLKKFFHFIKLELGKLINTDNFFIALHNEKTDMISTPYMVDELDNADDFPKGQTLTGYVMDSKRALLTKLTGLDPSTREKLPAGVGPESKCWLGVPMLIEDKAIGAIVVQSYTDENAYTQEDVAILDLIASNIGRVIKKTEDLVQINLLNKALIQSPQSVIITNLKGDIEYINPAFTELSGYSEMESIGKNPRILKSGKHEPEFYEKLWKTVSKGKTWEGEIINKHKNGSNYLVEANISSVKNENGKITHYIGVQEDITEKRQLERQFINAFIDAQEIEKQSFGEELHDGISQILSAEGMYISLLIEQNQDRINDKAKFLTKIKQLNASAVNETRNIAHGLMSSQLKQSGLLIAVENICADFNSSKNIMFSFLNIDVKEEELSKEIKTNLFRVIQELTTNITRYSSATNASVEFSRVNNDKLRLIIEDNGIGMDYDKIKKERKITGLKNVERRIVYLNGIYEVKSHPNNGTRWKITVPLQNIQ